MNLKKAGTVGMLVAVLASVAAPQASAHSSSGSTNYPGGDRLEANVWIQSFSWSGCGDWKTSAKLIGNNPGKATWIKNRASFSATGLNASISGSGGGASTSTGGAQFGREWTNNNNWISDLSGNVCGNGLTLYIGATSEAVANVPQYGSPRSAIATV